MLDATFAGSESRRPGPAQATPKLSFPASATRRYSHGDEIIAQGGRPEHGVLVIDGCVRTVRLLEDGRRQIGEFLLCGDVFGWELGEEHAFGAEAVTPVIVQRFSLSALEERAGRDGAFASHIRRLTAAQMRRMRAQLVLLGRKTASERVASFLVEMSERLRAQNGAAIELPMSRADIADYLGMTTETVCRGLAELRACGTIAVERSQIVVLDPLALDVAGSDRLH